MVIFVHGHFCTWPFLYMAIFVHGHFCTWPFLYMAIFVHGHCCTWPFLYMAIFVHGHFGTWPLIAWQNLRCQIFLGQYYLGHSYLHSFVNIFSILQFYRVKVKHIRQKIKDWMRRKIKMNSMQRDQYISST